MGKSKKILNIVTNIITAVFVVFCITTMFFVIAIKSNGGDAFSINNKEVRLVVSESMESNDQVDVSSYEIKSIRVKSLVIIDKVPENAQKEKEFYDHIEVGDVLTFKYYIAGRQEVITHRVIEKTPNGDGYYITLRGDNIIENISTQTIDTTKSDTSFNYIIGKVTSVNYPLGVMMTFLKSKLGIVLVLTIPCSLLAIVEIVKIYNLTIGEKRKKKNLEFEEMKKKLEVYEKEREENK